MTIHGAPTKDAPLFDELAHDYDAILLLSFGGPEGPDDVMPFLRNVTEGRNVPEARLAEVAEHYLHFGGVSPINQQNRDLIDALRAELDAHGIELPLYFGNRNWAPFVTDTVRQMRDDGVQRALLLVTSAFSSYSGCRQYREDMQAAVAEVEDAPIFDKIRVFYNHPGYINAVATLTAERLAQLPEEHRAEVPLLFTAHSIPLTMSSGSSYVAQLREASRLVAEAVDHPEHELVYQSRSGPPHIPWLEPDILDAMRERHEQGAREVVVVPIGFISDHMEVLFDLDTEAQELADELGMTLHRVPTVGTHPIFVQMLRDLIEERMSAAPERAAIGRYRPSHDICPLNCCRLSEKRSSVWAEG